MQKRREDFINSFNQKHSSIQRIFDDGDKPLENGKFKVKIEDIPDGIGKKMNEYAEDGETIIRTSQFYPDSDNKKFSLSTFTEFLENSKQNMYSITSAEQGTKFTYEEPYTILKGRQPIPIKKFSWQLQPQPIKL